MAFLTKKTRKTYKSNRLPDGSRSTSLSLFNVANGEKRRQYKAGDKKMKAIAFNGSPHADGVVAKGISVMAGELEKEGIETEIITVGNRNIRGCLDCRKCKDTGNCVIDDEVNAWRAKALKAEGIVLGSPVYYGSIAGTFKCFLDRFFFPHPDLRYKVGAAVVSLRRSGGIAAFQQINNYFNLAQILITPGVYWSVIHGNTPEELVRDEEGLQIMEIQGRNMAWLIKTLEAGKREVPPPPPLISRKRTNFIRTEGGVIQAKRH
jgi:multimeric flavodoxin WrbA